jgi:hypothetical protein
MAARQLTPELRLAERDAGSLLIVVGLVLANVIVLAALASS